MKVEQSFVIDGKVVSKTNMSVGIYTVYEVYAEDNVDATLYFVDKDNNVVSSMGIEADMGQGCGYISLIKTVNF